MALSKLGASVVPTPSAPRPDAPLAPRPETKAEHAAGSVRSADRFANLGATSGSRAVIKPEGAAVSGKAQGTAGDLAAQAAQDAKDQQKLSEMKTLLQSSPTGVAAMKYLEDQRLPVKFARGGGSYWDGKQIVIDRSESSQEAALTLVHEINHARASRTGTSGDILRQPRATYVETMLNEEVKGTVDSIRAKNELFIAGTKVTATFPLESEYNLAYKKAVEDLRKGNPRATDPQVRAAGEKAGYDRVMQGFLNGEVVTSVNGAKYPAYYGGAWDKNHPAAK